MKTLKTITLAAFFGLIIVLVVYIVVLLNNKFIALDGSFSLDNTSKVSDFLSVILTSLFSVGGSYLLIINYIEVEKLSSSDKVKQEKQLSSELAKMFFWEIQTSYIKLFESGIIAGSENTINYLNAPFVISLDSKELVFNSAISNFRHNGNHIKITEHLDKLEFLSLSILNGNIDLNLIEKFLKTKFLGQVKTLLIFLALCRNGNENYGESIIELYKKWDGEYGNILDRIKN
jgi:hypothetical protein